MHQWYVAATLISAAAPSPTLSSPPTAMIVSLCDEDPDLSTTGRAIAAALKKLGWATRMLPRNTPQPMALCASITPAVLETNVQRARDLFYGMEIDRAMAEFSRLLSLFESSRHLFGRPDIYARVNCYLGWLQHDQGRPEIAARHFRTIVNLASSWQPNPDEFPPPVVELFRAEVSNSSEHSRADLDIRTLPEGGTVYLDGGPACPTPCRWPGMAAGEHFLEVRHPSYHPHVSKLRVPASGSRNITVQLRPDLRGQLSTILATARFEELPRAPQLKGLDLVVAVRSTDSTQTVVMVSPSTRRFEVIRMTEAHSLPTLSEMVAAQAGPAAKAAEAGWVRPYQPPSVAQAGAVVTEVGHESPVELGPPLYQKIGVAPLALAGASLAALGTGIVFGTKALHHKNRADQGKPDWRSQVRQGKNDQLAANASFAIAAALALAGFGVWLSSDDVPAAGLSAVPSGSSSVLMLHLARPF